MKLVGDSDARKAETKIKILVIRPYAALRHNAYKYSCQNDIIIAVMISKGTKLQTAEEINRGNNIDILTEENVKILKNAIIGHKLLDLRSNYIHLEAHTRLWLRLKSEKIDKNIIQWHKDEKIRLDYKAAEKRKAQKKEQDKKAEENKKMRKSKVQLPKKDKICSGTKSSR
jgi:hypothetical protein